MTDKVWEGTLDGGAFQAQVIRDDNEAYTGWLVVYDNSDDALVHREAVPLAYAARFGPDVDDVNTWMERVTSVIDNPDQRKVDE